MKKCWLHLPLPQIAVVYYSPTDNLALKCVQVWVRLNLQWICICLRLQMTIESYPEIINIWCSRNHNLKYHWTLLCYRSDPVLLCSVASHRSSIEICRSSDMNVCNRNFPLKEKTRSQIPVWPFGISGYVSLTVFHCVFWDALPYKNWNRDIVGIDECLWSIDISVVGTGDEWSAAWGWNCVWSTRLKAVQSGDKKTECLLVKCLSVQHSKSAVLWK